jgi:hypothetical protein
MKLTLWLALPFAALALAAACGPTCQVPAESEQVYWHGECGPDAVITMNLDDRCHVQLVGAEQAGLPPAGTLNGTGSRPAGALLKDGVNLFDTDGGVITCGARPADGGLTVICHQPCPGVDAGENCDQPCNGFFSLTPP